MDVFKVMEGGRARWKIENETFNALKNRGYGLGHNFGHGKENLSFNIVLLMMLAFFVDQIFELKNELAQKVAKVYKRKLYLWDKIREGYQWQKFDSWEHFLEYLIERRKPPDDTS